MDVQVPLLIQAATILSLSYEDRPIPSHVKSMYIFKHMLICAEGTQIHTKRCAPIRICADTKARIHLN